MGGITANINHSVLDIWFIHEISVHFRTAATPYGHQTDSRYGRAFLTDVKVAAAIHSMILNKIFSLTGKAEFLWKFDSIE